MRIFGLEFEFASKVDYTTFAQTLTKAGLAVDMYATGHHRCPNECYAGWQVKSDASVSRSMNYPTAMELVSPPLTYRHFKDVKTALALARPIAQLGQSCGFHVHIYAPELATIAAKPNGAVAQRVKEMWGRVEPVLFSYAVGSRRNAHFCGAGISMEDRYRALNLHPLNDRRKTIEFRLHSGTLNATKALSFVWLCSHLTDLFVNRRRTVDVIPPDLFEEPEPKLIETPKTKFYLLRTKELWTIDHKMRTMTYNDLVEAHKARKEELGLSRSPFASFHYPTYGNAMTELCKQLKLEKPDRFRHYLERRYHEITTKFGFAINLRPRDVLIDDDADFFNEEELIIDQPTQVAPMQFARAGTIYVDGAQARGRVTTTSNLANIFGSTYEQGIPERRGRNR